MNCAKFYRNRLGVWILWVVKVWPFPLDCDIAVNTVRTTVHTDFFPGLAYWSDPCMDCIVAHNTRCEVKRCLFGVHTMADNTLGSNSPKTVTNGLLLARSGVSERPRDEWRHRRLTSLACSDARSPSLAERRILFIASWKWLLFCIFQWLSFIFGMEIQFWQMYTAFVGNLLYRLSRKMIPYSVLLVSFKNFKTLIRKRRILGEPFDLAQTSKS